MNSIQSLTEYGIEPFTAEEMIKSYENRIGTTNGVYHITDIAYDFDTKGRIVTLKCSGCGKEIQRTMITGRNKWSELIKTCHCQAETKRKLESENSKKIKKAKKRCERANKTS